MKWPRREPKRTQQEEEHAQLQERARLEEQERNARKKMKIVVETFRAGIEVQKTFPGERFSDEQVAKLTREYTEAREAADAAARGLGKNPEEASKKDREEKRKTEKEEKELMNLRQRAKVEARRLQRIAAQEKNKELAEQARQRRLAKIQENAKRREKGKDVGD